VVNVGNEDSDVIADDSEVIADDNETSSFMASNHPKVASSSKGGGGRGKSSLYERWKEDYDDSKCEDLIEEQLTFCDAYDIRISSHIRWSGGGRGVKEKSGVEPFAPSVTVASGNFGNGGRIAEPRGEGKAIHVHEECTKNTGAGEKKIVKKPSQTSRGVPVSNSNPFDVLNSVDNDGEFGTNGGTNNLVNNEAISSGSSFMNIDNDGEFASNTLIGAKIDKIERQIGEGKLRLLDNDGNPLVPTGIVKSDSEVEVVLDETPNLRIPTSDKDESDKCYGTNSLFVKDRGILIIR
ncbi:hypothetical protein Tco_0689421, partial [Tanacetum coccineum]